MPFINSAAPGMNKSMTVSVTNFDSIVSMQFVIRWDPTVLKYLVIDQFGPIPGLSISDFNITNAVDSGFVRLQWEGESYFPGVSLPDTNIFRLRLSVIGPDTSSSSIRFTEITNNFPALNFEIVKVASAVDSSLIALGLDDCELTHGFIAVGYTVATEEPNAKDALKISISPNPFSNYAKVEFNLEQKADVQAIIADASGRLVFQKDMPQLPAGKNGFMVDQADFPTKGAYFLTIYAGSQHAVRTLICN